MSAFAFSPLANPILLIGDNPCYSTGLARIGRDLAMLLSTMPEFRVAYLGRGIGQTRRFPFRIYDFPEYDQWGEQHIEKVWKDHSAGQPGIIMSVWDASRMLWFGMPHRLQDTKLEKFLGAGRDFEKWGYFAVDSVGPNGKTLPMEMDAAVKGYDRVLAASKFGADAIGNDKNDENTDWLPHGLPDTLFLSNQDEAIVAPVGYDILVGCVMTNQARKDWPVAFQTAAMLKQRFGNKFRFWTHSDVPINYWNLYGLAVEYGLLDCWEPTYAEISDRKLTDLYSNCSCTFLPSACEGFGYPIVESLGCGTPCVVTGYGAGAELVLPFARSTPLSVRIDTMHNVYRAVLDANDFATRVVELAENKLDNWIGVSGNCMAQVEHLRWKNLAEQWRKWFLAGIRKG